MNMLNSIILEGNVVRSLSDCEGVKDFEIEVIRYYKKEDNSMVEEKDFFTVELYGNLADSPLIIKNIEVGRGIRVVGRLKQKRWENEGKTFSKIVVIAEHIEFKARKQILPTD